MYCCVYHGHERIPPGTVKTSTQHSVTAITRSVLTIVATQYYQRYFVSNMPTAKLIVDEQDEAGNLVATYVQSSAASSKDCSRIDTIVGVLLPTSLSSLWTC